MAREIVLYINNFYPKYKHLEDSLMESCLIKSALCYQWLYKKYFGQGIDLQEIIYMQDYNMRKVGPSDLTFETKAKVMINHEICHDGFGRFYNRYGRG